MTRWWPPRCLRDDLYLHVKPGRETDRFYLLPENEKLQLLIRASVPKPAPPQGLLPAPHPAAASKREKGWSPAQRPALPGEPAVPMEDWWLVRDSRGQVGWMLSRRLDVDVPDEIAGYSEGQKIVGAYVLTKVYDPESSLPGKMVPEYVSVTNAYKDGLPYDFDQVRVFTWNVKKHRYETAYRQRNLEGYLPVYGEPEQERSRASLCPNSPSPSPPATRSRLIRSPERPALRKPMCCSYQLEAGMVKRVTRAARRVGPVAAKSSPSSTASPSRQGQKGGWLGGITAKSHA